MKALFDSISRVIVALGAWGLVRVLSIPGTAMARKWGVVLGNLAYVLCKADRDRAFRQFAQLDSSLSSRTRTVMVKNNFRNLGSMLLETISLAHRSDGVPALEEEQGGVRIDGLKEFRDRIHELRQESGVVAISAHLGAWELGGAALGQILSSDAFVLARRYDVDSHQGLVSKIRARLGTPLLYQDQSLIRALRALKNRQVIAMLVDLDIRAMDGIQAPFLGTDAHTTTAPARLALKTGSPLLPYFVVRVGDHYQLQMGDLIPVPEYSAEESEDQIQNLTFQMNEAICREIRRYPEQWIWMHPRWHSTPEVIAQRKARRALKNDSAG
ncbi:MAG: hypothetical protein H8E43_00490 [Planctomycetia bacterium]|nr:hypothetical protein [Planctomycetia bacterium]